MKWLLAAVFWYIHDMKTTSPNASLEKSVAELPHEAQQQFVAQLPVVMVIKSLCRHSDQELAKEGLSKQQIAKLRRKLSQLLQDPEQQP